MGRSVLGDYAYRKVYHYLEALIDEAQGPAPWRLPSLRMLSRRLRVSLATVQSAYSLLEDEGRVHCVPRSGYFVRVDIPAGGQLLPTAAGPMNVSPYPMLERSLFSHERRLARQRARGAAPLEEVASARLRNALAERYTRSSSHYWRAEEVHLAPDVQALLEVLLAALALRGGTVLVHSPCCWQVLRALQRCGMRVLEVPLNACGAADLQALARVLSAEPVGMLVMPSCLSTPQGRLMSPQDQQQIGQLLGDYPVWLLENDLDSELCFSGPPTARLRDCVDPRWLLVMGSFDATVGGEAPYAYVMGHHAALAEAFAQRAFQLAPLRLQSLAVMLGKGEIERQSGRLRAELQWRMEFLCRQLKLQLGEQVAFELPDGGWTLWLRPHRPVALEGVVAALSGTALRVVPGGQHGMQVRHQQYLALTWVGEEPDALQQALEKLAQALELRCGRPVGQDG
ncbi:MAG: GntR family transcriptional regulator [Pseudomonas putida]